MTSKSVEGRSEDATMPDRPNDTHSTNSVENEDGETREREASRDMLQTISDVSAQLCEIEENGEELAAGFQRIPNRRVLPDYFEVIQSPVAFSTVRQKVLKKQYSSYAEWVRDVAQIFHNAQVYNRPSAPIFGAAERLRTLFKVELDKLVTSGTMTPADATLPDLGELPPVEDSPPPTSDVDEEDVEEEEEDDEEGDDEDSDEDDSGDERHGRKRRRRDHSSFSGGRGRSERDDDAYKRRGRPPCVLTPMEGRIASILKGLRKSKDSSGHLLILPFEKLPDRSSLPDYYNIITHPIALDHIKKNAKRKKYPTVESVMMDIELLFENAKMYNEDASPLHQAAVELQRQARALAEQEKARPDDDFRDEDGKLPLAEIHHNGEAWRVGDWVHIRNPNDLAKPTVAQIYRTWQDRSGQRLINACWYYRPEQTVHRFDKHFYENEVVKTGQYRDHQIEEVIERCFVMFVTRFPKGRPRGFPRDKSVYVCESRYNEEKFRFAKIKTWASCVPDEVRERDYEMDMFDHPRRMRKIPSPIKHLLQPDAKETDPLPKPSWGSANAPPIVGAVHRRPREPNESPPSSPTPPLVSADAGPVPPRPDTIRGSSRTSISRETGLDMSLPRHSPALHHGHAPSPSPTPYNQVHMAPHFQVSTPTTGPVPMHHQAPIPVPHQPPQHMAASPQGFRPAPYQQPMYPQQSYAHAQGYAPSPALHHQPMLPSAVNNYHQPPAPRPATHTSSMSSGPHHGNMYNPPRPPEIYTLPENINDAIAPDVRKHFQRNADGRLLFFTAPPLDGARTGVPSASVNLGHSARYLAGREEWLEDRKRKRLERDEAAAKIASHDSAAALMRAHSQDSLSSQATDAMVLWFGRLGEDSEIWRREGELSALQGNTKEPQPA